MIRILLDTSSGQIGEGYLFENPSHILQTYAYSEVDAVLEQLETASKQGFYAAGFFAYELGYALEDKLKPYQFTTEYDRDYSHPLIWFALFENVKPLTHKDTRQWLARQKECFDTPDYELENLRFELDETSYRAAFQKAQKAIAAGDIYQLNFTFQSHFQFSGNPYALYEDLKRKQQMGYGALIETDDFTVLSASPELFLTFEDTIATARPMKGTVQRGVTLDLDQKYQDWLHQDEKSQAENLMIVDLMRNDLSRISEIGSVKVPELFAVETYPTLHQMTSTVQATLKPEIGLRDWVKALFPCGSITGAPKVRAMELIHDLEQGPRGLYTGAIGMIAPHSQRTKAHKTKANTFFNVAIRTLTLWPDGTGDMGIGSGVVSDSQADTEYQECLLKARFLQDAWPDFELIETLMYTPDQGYLYYEEHLTRLLASAEYFAFVCSLEDVETHLNTTAKRLTSPHCVRLLLAQDGRITVSATPVAAPDPDAVMRYVLSEQIMQSDNLFLYHKTTHRAFYDDEHAVQSQRHGCDEVIFCNEKGDLTEGSRTNIFLKFGDDPVLYTPPLESGLLPGTFRAALLRDGTADEACLTLDDLKRASEVYLGNSVRGLLRAEEIVI